MPQPFIAIQPTASVTPNNTSVNVDFAPGCESVLIVNTGAVTCFARVQAVAGAVAATVADIPIRAGGDGILGVNALLGGSGGRVSVFAAASTLVYVTPGSGGY